MSRVFKETVLLVLLGGVIAALIGTRPKKAVPAKEPAAEVKKEETGPPR